MVSSSPAGLPFLRAATPLSLNLRPINAHHGAWRVYLGRRSVERSGCSRYRRGTTGPAAMREANRIGLAIFSLAIGSPLVTGVITAVSSRSTF